MAFSWKDVTMGEALKLKPLCTSYLFSAALLGAVLALIVLPPTVANARGDSKKQVTICHRPGTSKEQTKTIRSRALDRHLGHGDTLGPCDGEGDPCPCAATGSAMELHELFLWQKFKGEPEMDHCVDEGHITEIVQADSAPEGPVLSLSAIEAWAESGSMCFYSVVDANWHPIVEEILFDLKPEEVEACREDIRKLMAELDDCPTPQEVTHRHSSGR
jgi:hypothetical protein